MVSKSRSFRRAIPAFGLALSASLALSVVGVASASAATQHFYVGGTKLAAGTPTGFTMKGTTNFTLTWHVNGIEIPIVCSSQKAEGTIENPAGGGAGVVKPFWFTLNGCEVQYEEGEESECKVTIKEAHLKGEATEFEGKSAVKFTPDVGPYLFSWVYVCGSLTNFQGSFTGIANNATSSFEFTKASSAMTAGGVKGQTLVGTSKLETTSGKTLTVAP